MPPSDGTRSSSESSGDRERVFGRAAGAVNLLGDSSPDAFCIVATPSRHILARKPINAVFQQIRPRGGVPHMRSSYEIQRYSQH